MRIFEDLGAPTVGAWIPNPGGKSTVFLWAADWTGVSVRVEFTPEDENKEPVGEVFQDPEGLLSNITDKFFDRFEVERGTQFRFVAEGVVSGTLLNAIVTTERKR